MCFCSLGGCGLNGIIMSVCVGFCSWGGCEINDIMSVCAGFCSLGGCEINYIIMSVWVGFWNMLNLSVYEL